MAPGSAINNNLTVPQMDDVGPAYTGVASADWEGFDGKRMRELLFGLNFALGTTGCRNIVQFAPRVI